MAQYYTIKEVAEILKVNERTISRWISDGKIQAVKIGGQGKGKPTRISEKEIEKLIKPIKE